MNVAHIEKQSFIYGPGCRYVIWVQGCSIRCDGCWNKEMWSFDNRIVLSIEEILQDINSKINYIDGITLLGGEPLDQFDEVSKLILECKKICLSIMLFTGYELKEIKSKKMDSILKHIDILITGRYDKNKRTINHQWIGSTNQQIFFLSNLFSSYKIENKNYLEITINENGSITIYGFPEGEIFDKLISYIE